MTKKYKFSHLVEGANNGIDLLENNVPNKVQVNSPKNNPNKKKKPRVIFLNEAIQAEDQKIIDALLTGNAQRFSRKNNRYEDIPVTKNSAPIYPKREELFTSKPRSQNPKVLYRTKEGEEFYLSHTLAPLSKVVKQNEDVNIPPANTIVYRPVRALKSGVGGFGAVFKQVLLKQNDVNNDKKLANKWTVNQTVNEKGNCEYQSQYTCAEINTRKAVKAERLPESSIPEKIKTEQKAASGYYKDEKQNKSLGIRDPLAANLDAQAVSILGMPYIEGVTLNNYLYSKNVKRIEHKKLYEIGLEIIKEIEKLEQETHFRHHDIKGQNILIKDVDGYPQITLVDFGMVSEIKEDATIAHPMATNAFAHYQAITAAKEYQQEGDKYISALTIHTAYQENFKKAQEASQTANENSAYTKEQKDDARAMLNNANANYNIAKEMFRKVEARYENYQRNLRSKHKENASKITAHAVLMTLAQTVRPKDYYVEGEDYYEYRPNVWSLQQDYPFFAALVANATNDKLEKVLTLPDLKKAFEKELAILNSEAYTKAKDEFDKIAAKPKNQPDKLTSERKRELWNKVAVKYKSYPKDSDERLAVLHALTDSNLYKETFQTQVKFKSTNTGSSEMALHPKNDSSDKSDVKKSPVAIAILNWISNEVNALLGKIFNPTQTTTHKKTLDLLSRSAFNFFKGVVKELNPPNIQAAIENHQSEQNKV